MDGEFESGVEGEVVIKCLCMMWKIHEKHKCAISIPIARLFSRRPGLRRTLSFATRLDSKE